MSRRLESTEMPKLYRVRRVDGKGDTIWGPYATKGAAKGRASSLNNGYYGNGADSHIAEETDAVWRAVE